MSLQQEIQTALGQVHDQPSFFNLLLARALNWPTSDVAKIEDIAYGWSAEELNAAHLQRDLLHGSIWQIQPADKGQPWGIFVLEFKRPELLS